MENSSNTHRNMQIDKIKGYLIFAMLVSHSWTGIVYLFPPLDIRNSVTFVTSSYVFISGFILGKYLLSGYVNKPNYRLLRDLKRAIRLYFIFLIPNLVLFLINYRNINTEYTLLEWLRALTVVPVPDLPVFEIIYAISIFMIIGSICLYILSNLIDLKINTNVIVVGIGVLTISILLIYSHVLDRVVGFGFLGLSLGFILKGISKNTNPVGNKIHQLSGIVLVVLMISIGHYFGKDIHGYIYIPYVLLALLGIYLLSTGDVLKTHKASTNLFITFGKHSLLIYLYQVAGVRILSILIQKNNIFAQTEYMMAFMFVLLLIGITMSIIAFLAEFYTNKYARIRYIYNMILK
jgi:fucose 4-O-acetylase-like acetyltransferase